MAGVTTGVISSIAVTTAYTVSTTKDLDKKLAMAEQEAKKDIAAVKLEAKKDMELTKMEAQKDIAAAQKDIAAAQMKAKKDMEAAVAEAKKETAERFLMFGYAAEFQEYRKQLKLGDHGKEETSATK